ncbi:hypothetical protein [Asanoa siamensis]|uniref:Uncharacterized protein n=1 Tax=Asanoa siamensis TaxID=926357 RepID=A0ABQ4CN22_9ACTN|nr:hypothetical protein [Asanoa siamensis]GIF72686.1 hypothetical protein Asi02nite_22040 [Asanoa siamensis]
MLDELRKDLAAAAGPVRGRLTPARVGLGPVAHGDRSDGDRTPAGGRPLRGRSTTSRRLLTPSG